MHLSVYDAQHINPALWRTITPEQRQAATSIDLEELNQMRNSGLDGFAVTNPIGAYYVQRRFHAERDALSLAGHILGKRQRSESA